MAASPASTSSAVRLEFAPGLTMIWFSPRSSTAMIAVPVGALLTIRSGEWSMRASDRTSRIRRPWESSPTAPVNFTVCAGAGGRDSLVASLAARAERGVRAPDCLACLGQRMDADVLVDIEASDHKNRAHGTCSFGGFGRCPRPQFKNPGGGGKSRAHGWPRRGIRCARRGADDQFAGEDDRFRPLSVDDVEQQPDRYPAHGFHIVRDDGQRRVQQGKPLDVVEGNEGHVAANAQALSVQRGQRADCHGAVGGQHCGRGLREGQQVFGSGRAAG